MENLIGRQIENYRIDALLGEGGMGAVFQATDVNLARPVALKVMHRQLANQPQFQKRFMQEAQAIARLKHPSIVTIYTFDMKHGLLYIVMEFIKGLSLGGYIKQLAERRQVVQLNETLNIIAQASDALGYAHRHGVVHRDIKPDNILIQPLDAPEKAGEPPLRAVLTDFGLAKLVEGGVETATGTFMGTLPYMSPEQALAQEIDGRSDIYSLGVVMYQLATGRLPFDIKTPTEAVMKHLKEMPTPPRQVQPGLPTAVEAVITKALAKQADERFQTGEEMAQALRQAMNTLTDKDVTTFATAADHAVVSMMTQLESASKAMMPSRMDTDETFEGGLDRLIIAQKGEAPKAHSLEKQTLIIGRQSDNDIVLTGHGVSRRHARLEKTAAGWQIVDLGSTNGTLLDNNKLLPDVPEAWSSDQTVQIGPFFLQLKLTSRAKRPPSQPPGGFTYQATAPHSVPPGASQIYSDSGQLSVVVNPTNIDVTPGSRADLQVELLNQGMTVDHFQVGMEGIPGEWVTIPPQALQLMPGTRGTIPVAIQPPQDSSARSGQHRYRLAVKSVSDARETATVSGSINVKPFTRFSVDMRPKKLKNRGVCRLSIRNDGNYDTTFTTIGRDPGEAIRYDERQKRLNVPAGKAATVDFKLQPKKRPFLGRAQTLPFEFNVGTADTPQQSLNGQMDVRPIIPPWLPPVLGALLVILCLVAAGSYFFVTKQNQDATATAEWLASTLDSDQDGLTDVQERELGTDPTNPDSDNDGLGDKEESNGVTDPINPDSDGDGLSDGDERSWGSNPLVKDTDGDTLLDGAEVHQEQPTSPIRADTDGDGINDNLDPDPGQLPTHTPTPTNTPLPTATTPPTGTPPPPDTPTIPPSATSTLPSPPTHTSTPPVPPTLDPDMIASYQLEDNAEDRTGNYGDITLDNAPFQADGGVFCNGIYSGDNRCLIQTPQLNSFDYDSFSISVQFKVTEFKTQPVFVGGNGWRWIGYYLNDDRTVSLLYNNSNREACGGEYELNKWHTAVVTYDGTEAKLYLDSFLRCTVNYDLEHNNDKNIMTTNFSNGTNFKGVIRNLDVYKKVITPFPILIIMTPAVILPIVTVSP